MILALHIQLALVMPYVGKVFMMAGSEEGGGGELPNILSLLTHNQGPLNAWVSVVFALLVSALLSVVAVRVYATRKLIPGPLQNVVEMAVEGTYEFLYTILGEDTKRYLPFLGTLFFYILFMNFMGIVPLGHAPSTDRNTTMALALLVFIYVQYTGLTRLGLKKYLLHLLGNPKEVATWFLSPLMLVIHLVGEVAKPVSLAARLFGNITGEDLLVAAFVGLGVAFMAVLHLPGSPVGIPFQLPFILLGYLLSTIQALVFALLSSIYILLMLPHEEHE